MEFRKEKCASCGSTKLEKLEKDIYRCKYCGCIYHYSGQKPSTDEHKTVVVDVSGDENTTRQEKYDYSNPAEEKSKKLLIRFLITLCFGTAGVHKLLDRKYGWFLVYLFTHGLFFVGWIYDVIISGKNLLLQIKEK